MGKIIKMDPPTQHKAGCDWIKIKCKNVQMFQYGDLPELIYIIKTGFEDTYIVVNEDAYNLHTGKTMILNKEGIQKTFNIKLEE